jgi:hypothetical protein
MSVIQNYRGRRTFIDIGAADGYYATGVVISGLFEGALCFETSAKGRDVIAVNAKLNDIQDKIVVYGAASVLTLTENLGLSIEALVLVDIEGGEFELFRPDIIRLLRDCVIIVELHDFYFENGIELKNDLISRAEEVFDVDILFSETLPCEYLSDFKDLNDDERALAFSECRPRSMEWLVFHPKMLC